MDLKLSDNIEESFRLFQSMVLKEYEDLTKEYGLHIIDATLSIEKQQSFFRKIVKAELQNYTGISYFKEKENTHGG